MITIENLRREYDSFVAVDGLNLEIPDGQFTVLLGPSGSGKTTVLRMLNRMVLPTSGTVRLDGEDLGLRKAEQLRRTMGYVIQNTGLFPNMTVRRNVATVPRLLGWDKTRINSRVDEMLELVGLDPTVYAQKLPSQLSGGEAQRVGVARALAADPPIILMDEPFGAVDPVTRTRLQLELRNLHQKLKKTIVFVTHDIDEAVLLADKIALLRNGKLQQYDTAEGFWKNPANDFVREFFGSDLGLRLMQRHSVSELALLPAIERDASPKIDAESSLNDALAALVNSATGRVVVVSAGRTLGVATFELIVDALNKESTR